MKGGGQPDPGPIELPGLAASPKRWVRVDTDPKSHIRHQTLGAGGWGRTGRLLSSWGRVRRGAGGSQDELIGEGTALGDSRLGGQNEGKIHCFGGNSLFWGKFTVLGEPRRKCGGLPTCRVRGGICRFEGAGGGKRELGEGRLPTCRVRGHATKEGVLDVGGRSVVLVVIAWPKLGHPNPDR